MINAGAHACRRRDRSRHRVVPQRPVAGLQDRRRHRPGPPLAVPCSKKRSPPSASTVWPMVEFEADDALAAAAAVLAAADPRVDRVVICTPDKDLAPVRSRHRVVQLNRRTRVIRDEAGVVAKFGVRAGRRSPTTWRSSATAGRVSRDCAGWGREIGGGRPRTLPPPRSDSRRLADLGRQRQQCRARSH